MSRLDAMRRHPAGKQIPESAEVRQARMDDEAIQLANSGQPRQVPEWVAVSGLISFGCVVLTGISAAAALAEEWPL